MIGEPTRIVWAGGEHDFCLDIGSLRALEQRAEAGVAVIMVRLMRGEFKIDDVIDTIRLALQCGSKLTDREAMQVIEKAFPSANLFDLSALAARVLALYISWHIEPGEDEPGESKAAPNGSESRSETARPDGQATSVPLQ
jgi:tail tube GTA-gp10-like protein